MPDTKKLKIAGQVVETSEEELANLAKKAGQVAPPTTPAGASGLTENPDQIKMAGSRQQKEAATKIGLNQGQTLQEAERLDKARTQRTGGEAEQAATAARMQELTKLDPAIQGMVNQHLATLQAPAGPTFFQEQLEALAPTADRATIEGALTQYHQLNQQLLDPELLPEDRDAIERKLMEVRADLENTHGIANPDEFIDVEASATAQAGAAAVMNPEDLTLGELDLEAAGYSPDKMQDLLGDGWSAMTVPQMQQAIQDIRMSEFSSVDAIKAQLMSLPPGSSQHQALMQQLLDMASVGITGIEDQVYDLQEQVDQAAQVQVGAEMMHVSEMLEDENISKMISRYLNPSEDEDWKNQLREENPEFAQWIDDNQEALSELAKQMEIGEAGFDAIQEQQEALAKLSEDMFLDDKVMQELIPGWGDGVVSSVTDLSENSLYKTLTAQDLDPKILSGIVSKLNLNPKQAADLQDMSEADIMSAHEAGDAIFNDDVLAGLIGVDRNVGFLTNEEDQALYNKYKPVIDKLRKNSTTEGYLEQPEMQEMLESGALHGDIVNEDGSVTPGNIDDFLKDPELYYNRFNDYNSKMTEMERIDSVANPQEAIDFLFGIGEEGDATGRTDLDTLNSVYKNLEYAYMLDPDSDSAKKFLNMQNMLDTDKDGDIDADDINAPGGLMEQIRAGLNAENPLSIDDIIGGAGKFDLQSDMKSKVLNVPMEHSSFVDVIRNNLNLYGHNGKFSIEQLLNPDSIGMTQKEVGLLMNRGQAWGKYIAGTPKGYSAALQKKRDKEDMTKAEDIFNGIIKSQKITNYSSTLLKRAKTYNTVTGSHGPGGEYVDKQTRLVQMGPPFSVDVNNNILATYKLLKDELDNTSGTGTQYIRSKLGEMQSMLDAYHVWEVAKQADDEAKARAKTSFEDARKKMGFKWAH